MAELALASELSFKEQVSQLRRRWRTVAKAGGGIAALALALALFLPSYYQSTATILIEQQEIPQDLVRSTITSFADQRIQVISQRVMTTQNLLQIIERYDLYPDIRRARAREAVLKRMRDDVKMTMIGADVIDPRSGRPTRANIAFTVAYENRNAELAYKVANELTTLYLNENVTSRVKQAEQASTFLSDEAANLSKQIASLDAQLAEFKKQHGDELPELSQLNITVADRTDAELRDAENRISTIDQQRLLLEAQLAQLNPSSAIFSESGQRILSTEDRLKAARSQLASLESRYSSNHPEVASARRELQGLEQHVVAKADRNDAARQLEAAQAELAAAREKYTEEHPDIRRLERQVKLLQDRLATIADSAPVPPTQPDNPAYIQVKGQLDALIAERDGVKRKAAELRAKLADYDARLAKAPEVERGYRALMRESDNARAQYQQIRAKQMEAQASKDLEIERKGERFTLIEPPLPPEEPVSPKRFLILGFGLVLSMGGGVGSALLQASLDGAVRSPEDLRRLLDSSPLALVPTVETEQERRARRRAFRWTWIVALAVILSFLVLVHVFVMPLDVAWFMLQRRFGV